MGIFMNMNSVTCSISVVLLSFALVSRVYAENSPDDPRVMAKSIVFSTENLCVPYVVDGVGVKTLTNRADIHRYVDTSHGQKVIHYVVNRPGSPVVIFAKGSMGRNNCWVWLRLSNPAEQPAVFALVNDGLHLNRWVTKRGHFVMPRDGIGDGSDVHNLCVYGKTTAVLAVSGKLPPPGSSNMGVIGSDLDAEYARNVGVSVDAWRGATSANGCDK
jgi:hypothetical protein